MRALLFFGCMIFLCACGGGSSGSANQREAQSVHGSGEIEPSCSPDCFLSANDVEQIIGQAIAEAGIRDESATIAVVDRVGNALGVYQMTGAHAYVTVTSSAQYGPEVIGGLENLDFIPSTLAALSKAMTAAYLSTTGNAFTTRTASQIVQENFNPGERDVPSGPLFGVQFSQLPCSDFASRFAGASGPGPHRAPLGLSGDPGGMPLYIDGIAVGGVGVVADGVYGLDKNIGDFDHDLDELIAIAATVGYAAPLAIRADQITLAGKTGRFSDSLVEDLLSTPENAVGLSQLPTNRMGELVEVIGYYAGHQTLDGTIFGLPASGIRPADSRVFIDADGNSLDAFVFVDAADVNRYPAVDGSDTPGGDRDNRLSKQEVQTILNEAISIANQSRAQIRVPVGSKARVSVAVVDTSGGILGMARSRDGPVFGADVSLQKARTATFFSGTGRRDGQAPAILLQDLPGPLYLAPIEGQFDLESLSVLESPAPTFAGYVTAVQQFLGKADALEATGAVVAFADRSGGNLSRPKYPDGPDSGPPGPLSKPPGEWSIFSTGLQLDLSYNAIIHHVAFALGLAPDVPRNCTGNTGFSSVAPFTQMNAISNLANGLQIFPGSVPIFRGDILVGGIGVSGDGVDQDDMISFLGLHRAGLRLASGIGNAPVALRADRLIIPGQSSGLRYVNCPQVPFIGSSETEVCDGL